MRTVFLHGLGQTAKDWDETIKRTSDLEADCPEVFSLAKTDMTYSQILKGLKRKYADVTEPFRMS